MCDIALLWWKCRLTAVSESISYSGWCCRLSGGGRALKLGGKKDVESFVDQLKSEGERMFFLVSLFSRFFDTKMQKQLIENVNLTNSALTTTNKVQSDQKQSM